MIARRLLRADAMWWPTLLVAGAACLVTFLAHGGLNLESTTTTEIVLTLGSGAIVAGAIVLTPAARSLVKGPKYGLWPLGLLLAFTALSGLSVVWSVQPDVSWQDANRLLAYSGVFAAAIALVRLAPDRWPAILGGLALGAVAVCGYALATKVFPGTLVPASSTANTYARLEEPYGYWNAIGLTAAMGAICCMWLGAKRDGHALLRALAYPAMGVLLVTLMLAYSRGALAALAIGLALWFAIVPLRLRGAAILIVSGVGAAAVVGLDFSKAALSTDNIPLAERATAGHELGALLVVMIVLLTLAGVAIGFATGRRAPGRAARDRMGLALLAAVALALIAFAGALAHSERGLEGSVSHAVSALTNPNAKPPPNTPGRLTAVASVRARYWKQAIEIFEAHPALGAGADGYETASLRYRTALLEVKHAHGFLVQTLADLGLVGLAIVLALLACWLAAAGRATHPFNRRWTSWGAWLRVRAGARPGWWPLDPRSEAGLVRYTPERVALLSMLCMVVVFGVHSFIDWTWYVPGDAFAALLCAGWLAGRGPLDAWRGPAHITVPRSLNELTPIRAGIAVAVAIAALLAAWSQYQPQRSVDASQEALDLLATKPQAALARAQTAVSRDPLSAQALIDLATIQADTGRPALAKATLERAVRLQPSNPQTWLALARHDLTSAPAAAVKELQAAIYLNPESIAPEAIAPPYANPEYVEIYNDYIQALRATGTAAVDTTATASATAAGAIHALGRSSRASGARALGAGRGVAPVTSARARPGKATTAARRAARRRRAPRLLESRTAPASH
ncbi:MAG TPA: O-antigen ligase family protein [Solirubrobacteraceae bacterium]|nr:O-antigen ligase family protein [Solirubrobacteraceae bacterium]